MTVMVPLGNLAFALPFMPQNTAITPFDLTGLIIIMVGLVGYRKGPEIYDRLCPKEATPVASPSLSKEGLYSPLTAGEQ